jgi:type I restriction enzyme S subunit
MTEVSKASAYPKSVQSGLPRLGTTPPGWLRGPLSQHLFEEVRPVKMADDEIYDLVTVKRSRGGVVRRERLKGREIAVKSQFRLKAGDFLISKRQIVHGACGIVPLQLEGAIVSNEYSVLRARPSLDLEFLNCLAHSVYFQQTCFHSSIGVHVEKMIFKLSEWLKWDFDLPPVCEQRRIADVLCTWDRAIEAVGQLIANAEDQKAALIQMLLTGRTRLPGFSGDWSTKSLDALFWFKKGRGLSKGAVTNDGANPCLLYGELYTRYPEVIDEVLGRTDDRDGEPSVVGDVLIPGSTTTSGIDLANATALLREGVLLGGDINILRAKDRRQSAPFFAYLLTHVMKAEIASRAQGITIIHLYGSDLKPLQVSTPSDQEQHAIARILMGADAEIVRLKAQLTALRKEKAGLMQQLLAGKRRVRLSESEAA